MSKSNTGSLWGNRAFALVMLKGLWRCKCKVISKDDFSATVAKTRMDIFTLHPFTSCTPSVKKCQAVQDVPATLITRMAFGSGW